MPVWPVLNGVFLWLVGRLLGVETASRWEPAVRGRVCPMQLLPSASSPFLLLVHHTHSFASWDPVRYFQRQFILPEGFPAHPHRGFVTLTIMLEGAFSHRDSLGVCQEYGSELRHHSQWLNTGSGLLHEEMFINNKLFVSNHELYQLWINLPAAEKMREPQSILLGDQEAPIVREGSATTTVYAGTYQGHSSAVALSSPMVVLRVQLDDSSEWTYACPLETCLVYIRQGSLRVPGSSSSDSSANDSVSLEAHTLTTLDRNTSSMIRFESTGGADFLVMAGKPLMEPVAMQGSMVMNTYDEINQAYLDYQSGLFGRPWDHKLSNEEWQTICIK